ncbi:SH3 domain-containing protein [Sinimarinibacterium thermocellulolyticum]|uniref:SH3 domain-containing protein n=1 Tax=Sinimarinibacterium thermocellulolyticum TaxID=3170016 RepID=A0ABV2A7R3_9GAMM
MFRTPAIAALLAVAASVSAARAEVPAFADELGAFVDEVRHGALLTPQRYRRELAPIRSRDQRRAVLPTLDVVAGRLDERTCLYQFRLALEWSGKPLDQGDATVGGRSLIQQAPCATLSNEVVALAVYEIAALERRLQQGGRFALNRERDAIIAAARRLPAQDVGAQHGLTGVTIDGRVNLRMAPSLDAPVLAKLAPASVVQLAPTASPEWFAMRDQPGYLHASALRSIQASHPTEAPPPVGIAATAFLEAQVGAAHVSVRDSPSLRGRVLKRLKPGTPVQLIETPEAGWFELVDGEGFIHEAGLLRVVKSAAVDGGAMRPRSVY